MAAPEHDWYLPQWLRATAATQADIVVRTGYTKSKISKLTNGHQPYDRDTVNEISAALHIAPFELLMHPDDAMRIRRLRDTAMSIAADNRLPFGVEPNSAEKRTG